MTLVIKCNRYTEFVPGDTSVFPSIRFSGFL